MMSFVSFTVGVTIVALLLQSDVDAFRAFSYGKLLHRTSYHRDFQQQVNPLPVSLTKRFVLKNSGNVGKDVVSGGDNASAGDWLQDETYRHLREEFVQLSQGKPSLSYKTFMKWEEIQALLVDGLLTREECEDIWTEQVESLDNDVDMMGFIRINQQIDDLFEENEDEDDEDDDSPVFSKDLDTEDEIEEVIEEYEIPDDSSYRIDPWSDDIVPVEFFDKEYLKHIRSYFIQEGEEVTEEYIPSYRESSKGFGATTKKNEAFRRVLTFKKFISWEDIESLEQDGSLDITSIEEAWMEAMNFQQSKNIRIPEVSDEAVTWETFLRLMLRLDIMMEDIQSALESLSEEDVKNYYRECFEKLTKGKSLLFYEQLLEWDELKHIIENKDITVEQVKTLWDFLPKEAYTTRDSRDYGINIEGFFALNEAIEEAISSTEAGNDDGDDLDIMQ